MDDLTDYLLYLREPGLRLLDGGREAGRDQDLLPAS